jgi:RHS repeat-associated protein
VRDGLGSTAALTSADGTVVERYTYDAYGTTYVETPGGAARSFSAYGNPFLWTGQRYDAGVGQYHFHARSLWPAWGRWLQRDPLGYVDGVNLYEYVGAGPLRWTDPLGLCTATEWLGGVCASADNARAVSAAQAQRLAAQGDTQAAAAAQAGATQNFNGAFWEGAGQGAVTGAKAVGNATIDTAVSTATLGTKQSVGAIPVSQEDMDSGYAPSYGFARAGTEILAGVLTAGASKYGEVGALVAAADITSNIVGAENGVEDMAKNGPNAGNVTQLAASAAGLGANAAALRQVGKEAGALGNATKCPTRTRGYDRPEIETRSGRAVKDTGAVGDWDDFLGPNQTNIDPRTGQVDPDRIWSADGNRSIRYGEHEMNSAPNKQHYHRETWHETHVENELQRVQQTGSQ